MDPLRGVPLPRLPLSLSLDPSILVRGFEGGGSLVPSWVEAAWLSASGSEKKALSRRHYSPLMISLFLRDS